MLGNKGRGPRKVGGFLLAVATSALLFAWWAGVASAATGTLEICKQGAPGTNVAGSTFTFNVARGAQTPQTVNVTPPQCSQVTVNAGTIVVTENTSSGGLNYGMTDATTSPTDALVSVNQATAKVKVAVAAGQDVILTVTNALAASSVKICKTSTDFTTPAPGPQYTYSLLGTTVQATANGPCSNPVPVQAGSVFVIAEQVPAGEQVTSVTNNGGTIRRDFGDGRVRFQAGNGVNVVTYDNEAVGPPQTGLLEVCKDAGDQFVKGTFNFTYQVGNAAPVPIPGGITVGQCTSAIQVPAGNVLVAEQSLGNYQLGSVYLGVNSAGALGTVNTTNGTAVVVVPVASSGDVQVHFVNVTPTTQLKVCKFLAPGSESALQGQTFTFDVTDDQFAPGTTYTVTVTVPAGATSACSIVRVAGVIVPFPIGSTATVTERAVGNVDGGGGIGQPSTETTTIVPGVNEIDFTNTAFGVLEVCKYMVGDDPSFGQTFTFNYQNTANPRIKGTVTATAGTCSFPRFVPAGTYTVTEDLSKLTVKMTDGTRIPVFGFVASDARGNLGDSRCVPQQSYPAPTPNNPPPGSGCGNPATVTVPWLGANGGNGETQVSFWNRVFRASVKICKVVSSDSTATLANTTWTYTINTADGGTFTGGPLGNGQCTGNIGNYPVAVQGPVMNGQPTMLPNTVTVVENHALNNPVWFVSGISLSGGYDAQTNFTTGTIVYHTGPGPNVVTYTNTARPATVPA